MNDLEKKLKVQLGNVEYILKLEKENADLKSTLKEIGIEITDIKANTKAMSAVNKDLIKENVELKKQLEGIRYFNRDEVKQIFLLWQSRGYLREDVYIDAICNLAIKPITRERIIKVLGSPLGREYKAECNITRLKDLKEQLATQIIGDDNND